MGQSYTVFLNDKVILISEIINNSTHDPNATIAAQLNQEDLKVMIRDFSEGDSRLLMLLVPKHQLKIAWMTFRSVFRYMKAAGGVVKGQGGKILFIHRYGKWDLPKGKIEDTESARKAALREVAEETGLTGMDITRRLEPTYHIYPENDDRMVLKKTSWYEMSYTGNEEPAPQTEEGIVSVVWLGREQSDEVLSNTYESLKDMIRRGFKNAGKRK